MEKTEYYKIETAHLCDGSNLNFLKANTNIKGKLNYALKSLTDVIARKNKRPEVIVMMGDEQVEPKPKSQHKNNLVPEYMVLEKKGDKFYELFTHLEVTSHYNWHLGTGVYAYAREWDMFREEYVEITDMDKLIKPIDEADVTNIYTGYNVKEVAELFREFTFSATAILYKDIDKTEAELHTTNKRPTY
jgi:hypothetical protein